jgi:hypothetical protein
MNIDRILAAFNEREVQYLLIGGVNFLLRHRPVTTFGQDRSGRRIAEERGS